MATFNENVLDQKDKNTTATSKNKKSLSDIEFQPGTVF